MVRLYNKALAAEPSLWNTGKLVDSLYGGHIPTMTELHHEGHIPGAWKVPQIELEALGKRAVREGMAEWPTPHTVPYEWLP